MANFWGTDTADTLDGTSEDDVLNGLGGNDRLSGGGGNDYLNGDDGDDTLLGGDGNDTLRGDLGIDFLDGGAGNDFMLSPLGFADGGDGDDQFAISAASAFYNTVDGGPGYDVVNFSLYAIEAVVVDLETGVAATAGASRSFLSNVEAVIGTLRSDCLRGDANNNFLDGLWGDDTLFGLAGADRLYGHNGDDVLEGGAGDDRIDGGADVLIGDVAVFTGVRSEYVVHTDIATGITTVSDVVGGRDGTDKLALVEELQFADGRFAILDRPPGQYGTAGDDDIYGTASSISIFGLAGDDRLSSAGGASALYGGDGQDTLVGAYGTADQLDGGAGNDSLVGGTGNFMYGDEGDDSLVPGWMATGLTMRGGEGNDLLQGGDDMDGGPGNDRITGTGLLYGGDGRDELYGSGTLDGGAGDDSIRGFGILRGGEGADYLFPLDGEAVMDGGAGIDTAFLAGGLPYTLEHGASSWVISVQGRTHTMQDVERILFSNGERLALDIAGNGGMAYRLYQAAFSRVPDLPGLGYQMNALDSGLTITQVAENFIASPEFSGKYGSLSQAQFVTQLYANVLHRTPDAGGLAYHLDHLAHGFTRADVLVGFSESPENQANVIGAIGNGIEYVL